MQGRILRRSYENKLNNNFYIREATMKIKEQLKLFLNEQLNDSHLNVCGLTNLRQRD